MTSEARDVDVLVVGAGAGGMVAALAASAAGFRTLVIEKSAAFGGTTAMSGGSVWVPNAPQIRRAGVGEDPEHLVRYLAAVAGESVAEARIRRYIEAAPQMMAFLESQSGYLRDGFAWMRGYPDYFPSRGGSTLGWGLQAKPLDRRLLGDDEARLRVGMARIPGVPRGMWITGEDLHSINRIRWGRGAGPYRTLARLLWRTVRARTLGERMVANGAALTTRLWLALREAGVPVLLETPLRSLTVEAGRVTGVETDRTAFAASHAVVLATGGFSHDATLRDTYQPSVPQGWSIASTDDEGDGHRAAMAIGADVDLMDEAWWYPVAALPDGPGRSTAERQYPGQFIVGVDGRRFCNEALPYTEFGRAQIRSGNVPAWMITDDRAIRRNILFAHFPGLPLPQSWFESGLVKRAATMQALAGEIGVSPDALWQTAERYNGFARAGKDGDFGRGESVYENYYGNPKLPNPNLEPVGRSPFYAFALYPGDIGTNGGVVTDEDARVLAEDGNPIEGLYACGNVSASVMGTGYAGLGATIGAAMTYGWVAAQHVARSALGAPVLS
jgi:glycine/D-amino acid oxidase-like deaminating enzyme